jgi:putative hydrolase of the HAD superfamily
MTPIPGSIAVLHEAATLGTVSLLSNNPIPFKDSLPVLTPEIVDVLGGNDLVSAVLGARKPERRIYTRALGRFGVEPSDAILFDDSLPNVEGARACGMHAHHVTRRDDGTFDTDAMLAAAHAFASR